MLTCAETHGNVAETLIFYISVDVIIPKCSRKYEVTFRKYVFLLSFEHNIPEIPYLTNEHQEKRTAGMYEMSNVLKMYRISRCGQPDESR